MSSHGKYTPWTWSAAHNRHYAYLLSTDGRILETIWSGPPSGTSGSENDRHPPPQRREGANPTSHLTGSQAPSSAPADQGITRSNLNISEEKSHEEAEDFKNAEGDEERERVVQQSELKDTEPRDHSSTDADDEQAGSRRIDSGVSSDLVTSFQTLNVGQTQPSSGAPTSYAFQQHHSSYPHGAQSSLQSPYRGYGTVSGQLGSTYAAPSSSSSTQQPNPGYRRMSTQMSYNVGGMSAHPTSSSQPTTQRQNATRALPSSSQHGTQMRQNASRSPPSAPQYTYSDFPGPQTIRSNVQSLPPDVQAHIRYLDRRYIQTSTDPKIQETLDDRFRRVVKHHHAHFFVLGRVFKMLWTEPAGQTNPGKTRNSTHFSTVWLGEEAFSEIRYFVVVRNKGTFSQCIPIQTYKGRGATKPGLIMKDHGIIHTSTVAPNPLPGEYLDKYSIRIQSTDGEELDPHSRVNYGKAYAVEHNVKLLDIGKVVDHHQYMIENYFDAAMRGE